jgi:predicted secreted protein
MLRIFSHEKSDGSTVIFLCFAGCENNPTVRNRWKIHLLQTGVLMSLRRLQDRQTEQRVLRVGCEGVWQDLMKVACYGLEMACVGIRT